VQTGAGMTFLEQPLKQLNHLFLEGMIMAKIIVPKSNERERAMFAKLNITLIESITEKEFENAVVEYLSTHNVLHLCTCRDNEPRATPLEYFNNGLTVHIFSEGGGKFANLKVNPKVSYSISDPYDPAQDFMGAVGLQVWGTAAVFKKNDDPARFQSIHQFSRNAEALKKHGIDQMAAAVNFNVITIEPTKIRYLDMRKGFRNISWEKEQ
jgi:general stress protein 26